MKKKLKLNHLIYPTLDGSKEIPIFLIENNIENVNRDELKRWF